VSAATEQVEEKAQVEAGTEAVDKAVDETKKIKPKKAAIEGC